MEHQSVPWFGQALPADWEGTSSKLFCVAMEIETSISSSFSCFVFLFFSLFVFWSLLGIWLVGWLSGRPTSCSSSVFSLPTSADMWVYFAICSHQTLFKSLFIFCTRKIFFEQREKKINMYLWKSVQRRIITEAGGSGTYKTACEFE